MAEEHRKEQEEKNLRMQHQKAVDQLTDFISNHFKLLQRKELIYPNNATRVAFQDALSAADSWLRSEVVKTTEELSTRLSNLEDMLPPADSEYEDDDNEAAPDGSDESESEEEKVKKFLVSSDDEGLPVEKKARLDEHRKNVSR